MIAIRGFGQWFLECFLQTSGK